MVSMMDILSGATPLMVDVRQSGPGPVEQARPPAIMWVSKPMTRPDRRACLLIISHPCCRPCGRAHRAGPDQCRSLVDHLAQLADLDSGVADGMR
jgi:hypothetical protein